MTSSVSVGDEKTRGQRPWVTDGPLTGCEGCSGRRPELWFMSGRPSVWTPNTTDLPEEGKPPAPGRADRFPFPDCPANHGRFELGICCAHGSSDDFSVEECRRSIRFTVT